MNSPRPGPRYQALLDLLRTADTLWNASHAFFAEWQLSPSQFNILNLVVGAPRGLTQTALSRALLMHRSNVTGLVDRLEERGLVSRRPRPGDRRARHIVLTPTGRRLVQSILPRYYAAAERVSDGVPRQHLPDLVQDLAAIRRQADRMTATLRARTHPAARPHPRV